MSFGRGSTIFLSRCPGACRCRIRFRLNHRRRPSRRTPELMPDLFTYSRMVQFAETDLAGIAHFANFFRWMEEAEHAYFRSVGLSVRTEYQEMEIGWPRVSTSCEFFVPARFEDQLQIAVRITKMGEKSITWEIEFSRDGTRLALGKEIGRASCR